MLPNSADSFEKFRKLIKVSRRLVRTSVAWFLENSFRPKAAGKEMVVVGEFWANVYLRRFLPKEVIIKAWRNRHVFLK